MIYLIAGNGSPNFGDELIVQNWLRFYRENGYTGLIVVDGKGSDPSRRLLRGFGDVQFVTRIPRHADGYNGSYSDFFEIGRAYALSSSNQFKDVQGFHFLGGGYASANWCNASRLLSTVVHLGSRLSVPVVATGLGISPFKELTQADKQAWKSIIDGCLIFECRDEESYDDLLRILDGKSSSLTCGLDDAFLYEVPIKPHEGQWLHLSGFSQHAVMGQSEDRALNLFEKFDRVLFWTCSKTDAALHASLAEKYPVIARYNNERLLNEGLPIGKGDFMITGRFHPHLEAARVGISGYYTADSGFYKTKHGLVTGLGSPFKSLRKSIDLFQGDSSRMIKCDPGRVEEKRRIGRRVLSLFGVSGSREASLKKEKTVEIL